MSGPKTSYVSVNTQQQAALARQQRENGQPLNLEFQEDINKPNMERKLH